MLIAEIGSNHGGDLATALKMIEVAADSGVDAVKFQMRDNKTLFTKAAYDAPYHSENAYGPTYGRHREALELTTSEMAECRRAASECGVGFGVTVFDFPSLDRAAVLGPDFLKIASGDATNTPLLEAAGETGLRLLVSTGGCTFSDVQRAMDAADVDVLMHCVATYPSKPEEQNLLVLKLYGSWWPHVGLGLSCHHSGILMPPLAYMLGARTFEVHFTLDRASRGTDHGFSLEPQGLAKLARDLNRTALAMGDGQKRVLPSEKPALEKMGKSIYYARDLPKGWVLTITDLVCKSPGGGLPPYRLDEMIGRQVVRAVRCEERLDPADVADVVVEQAQHAV